MWALHGCEEVVSVDLVEIPIQLAVAQTYSISKTGDSMSSGFTFPFDTASHGVILGVSVDTQNHGR